MFFNSLTVILTAPTVVIIRYRTPRFNKIFGSYFFVFGKCGVTPRRLYRGSLTSRLNLILKRVILLSVLAIFSVPNKIFSMTFLSSYMIKCFKPSTPKESKKKIYVFGSISSIIYQCVSPFSLLSVLAITKGYLPCFSDIIDAWLINLFIWLEGKTQNYHLNLHLQCFLWHFQFEHYLFLCSLLNTTKKICQFIFCFVLCFLHDLVCCVRIQCSLNIFIFNFLCSISKKIWNTFNSGVYYFFPSSEFIFWAHTCP